MAKSENELHILDSKFLDLHLSPGKTCRRGCLNRHEWRYKENDPCSHRWQAYEHAKDYSHWYNAPAYQELVKEDNGPKTFRTTVWGNKKKSRDRPIGNNWDLDQECLAWDNEKKKKVPTKNFMVKSSVPYYHNAHHIIPNGILNGCIFEVTKDDDEAYLILRIALLEAEYNLNDKNNMIILPMCKRIASVLGLPRHIAGIEGTSDGKHYNRSHPQYSQKVEDKVKEVLSPMIEKIDKKACEDPQLKIKKTKLERISDEILMRLRMWQSVVKSGASLDDMPEFKE